MRITVFDWAPAATPGAVKVYVALHVPPLDEQLLIPPETALPPLTETDPNEDGLKQLLGLKLPEKKWRPIGLKLKLGKVFLTHYEMAKTRLADQVFQPFTTLSKS